MVNNEFITNCIIKGIKVWSFLNWLNIENMTNQILAIYLLVLIKTPLNKV
jgi:hypothetical protein